MFMFDFVILFEGVLRNVVRVYLALPTVEFLLKTGGAKAFVVTLDIVELLIFTKLMAQIALDVMSALVHRGSINLKTAPAQIHVIWKVMYLHTTIFWKRKKYLIKY